MEWTTVGWVLVLLAVLFYYFIFRPFLKGQLPLPLAKWVGRAVHYPKLPFVIGSFALGLRKSPYWSKIDDDVYLGCLPTLWNCQMLAERDMQIRAVVNMCDEAFGPSAFYKEKGIEQLYLPTVDHTEPTLADMQTAVKFIEKHVQKGNKVLIHCMAGRGRSAAVAMAWLLYRHKHLDLDKAQQLLLAKRAMVRGKLNKQRVLMNYYSNLLDQRKLVN